MSETSATSSVSSIWVAPGIRAQNAKVVEEAALRKATQAEAHATLVGSFQAVKAAKDRLEIERDGLLRTVKEQRGFKTLADDLTVTVRRLEAERKEVDRQLLESRGQAAELTVALQRQEAQAKDKDEEVERLRRRVAELEAFEGNVEVRDFHIPLKDNRLHGEPSITTSHDQTEICFLDPERGVGCLHVHLAIEGRMKKMTIRKTRRARLE